MFSLDDQHYMARALQLAQRGVYSTHPNPRVGCVLVKDNHVVGEGWHKRAGEPHAESYALQAAGAAAHGATAYVTLEPCAHTGRTPPCTKALINAGVRTVIAAVQDPDSRTAGEGLAQLRAAGIETQTGLLEAQARRLNAGFFSRLERKKPWVTVKLAMSVDGRTAMTGAETRVGDDAITTRASGWITNEAARTDVQYLRARHHAIITGSGTVQADNPRLNVRLAGDWRQPLRVVLDTQLITKPDAAIINLPGDVLLLTAQTNVAAAYPQAVEIETVALKAKRLDLAKVVERLAERNINDVLVEAGPALAGAFMEAGLVDELVIYMAPHLMGHRAKPLVDLPGIERMDQRLELDVSDIRAVGKDWRITAAIKKIQK